MLTRSRLSRFNLSRERFASGQACGLRRRAVFHQNEIYASDLVKHKYQNSKPSPPLLTREGINGIGREKDDVDTWMRTG